MVITGKLDNNQRETELAKQASYPRSWKLEAGRFGVQGRPQIYGEFRAHLGSRETVSQEEQSDRRVKGVTNDRNTNTSVPFVSFLKNARRK